MSAAPLTDRRPVVEDHNVSSLRPGWTSTQDHFLVSARAVSYRARSGHRDFDRERG